MCESPVLVPRRSRVEILNDKLATLQSKLASVSAKHDHDLLLGALFDKIRSLDPAANRPPGLDRSIPLALFPHTSIPVRHPSPAQLGKVSEIESVVGYEPSVPRPQVCDLFGDWEPKEGQPMPRQLSLYLCVKLSLFLDSLR